MNDSNLQNSLELRSSGVRSEAEPSEDRKDWVWQMQNRIRTVEDLARFVRPTADESGLRGGVASRGSGRATQLIVVVQKGGGG